MKNPCTLFFLFLAFGCGTMRDMQGETCFKRKRTLIKATFTGKMTEENIKLRRGNYYEIYSTFFGMAKSFSGHGRYRQSGDTLFFMPCDSMPQWSDTGRIDMIKGEIVLHRTDNNYDYNLIFRKNRTKK